MLRKILAGNFLLPIATLLDKNLFLFSILFCRLLVSFLESLNSSASINDFLCAGIERMAIGADVNANFRHRGAGNPFMSAGTFDLGFGVILWMDVLFHPIRYRLRLIATVPQLILLLFPVRYVTTAYLLRLSAMSLTGFIT